MDNALQMLEQWDAGQPVHALRLTGGGPSAEQSAHLLAMELIRDLAGLPLPATGAELATWGADAVGRVQALPHIELSPSVVATVKAYVFNLLKSGWEPLASATPAVSHITVSRTLPGAESPVSPKTIAAAKDHDRLAAWILAELPEEIRGDPGDVSAALIAIRLLTDWKAHRRTTGLPPRAGVGGEPNAPAPHASPALAELLQDLEDRLGDKLELGIGQAVAPLVARLSALEGQGTVRSNRKPGPSAPAAEPSPIVVGSVPSGGPPVVEGKRPTGKTSFPELEHQPRGRER